MAKVFLGQVVSIVAETGMCSTSTGDKVIVMRGNPTIGDYLFKEDDRIYVGGMPDIQTNKEAKKRYDAISGALNQGHIPPQTATDQELDNLSRSSERNALEEKAKELGIKVTKNMKDEAIKEKIEKAKLKQMEESETEDHQEYNQDKQDEQDENQTEDQ